MHLAQSLVGRVTELAVTAAPTSCSAMSRGDPGAVMVLGKKLLTEGFARSWSPKRRNDWCD